MRHAAGRAQQGGPGGYFRPHANMCLARELPPWQYLHNVGAPWLVHWQVPIRVADWVRAVYPGGIGEVNLVGSSRGCVQIPVGWQVAQVRRCSWVWVPAAGWANHAADSRIGAARNCSLNLLCALSLKAGTHA